MGEHYIEKCACGIIVSQCRCPEGFGETKSIRIVKCTHPNPPVTDAYTKEAVEWMNAPTGPMPNLTMTDARREPVTRYDLCGEYGIVGMIKWQDGDYVTYDDYRALADRLAASERELEAIRDTVGDTEFALRQQVARLRESLFHMQVCRLCSEEGAWDECEHGRGALQALRETGA